MPMVVESFDRVGQPFGRLGDLTFPPGWPPPWQRHMRAACGLPLTPTPPVAPVLAGSLLSESDEEDGVVLAGLLDASDGSWDADEW